MGYAFIVEYKKGKDNLVADALSRLEDEEGASSSACTLCIISFPTHTWIPELKDSYESNPDLYQLLQAFQTGGGKFPKGSHCRMDSYYKGRIYLGPKSHLKFFVLHYVQNSPLGGQSDYLNTLHKFSKISTGLD